MFILQINAFAGWVITEKSVDGFKNESICTVFIQNNVIRYESPMSIAIVNFNTKLITIVFSQYKAYWQGTLSELKANSILAYDMQLEKLLAGLPKHEQIELDSIYQNIKAQLLDTTNYYNDKNISIKQTDDNLQILGYNTIKYGVYKDSVFLEDIWHTTQITPFSDINKREILLYMRQISNIQGFSEILQHNVFFNPMESGMILKSVKHSSLNIINSTEVIEILNIDINPYFFNAPKNYQSISLNDVLFLSQKNEK